VTYTVYDKSAALGAPYELFKFVGVLGSYYYTNLKDPVTFEGQVYEPLQITRGVTEVSAITTSIQTVNFDVPTSAKIFEDNGRSLSPPDMTVEVFRFHVGAEGYKRRVLGTVTGHSVKNETYTLETKSAIQTQLTRKVASVYYQNMCNNELFDQRCKLDPLDYRHVTGIVSTTETTVTVDDDAHADGALKNGRIRIGNEERVIVNNVSNVISIAYPFIKAADYDTATITRGCDYLRSTCVSVFDNVANYSGFPTIPTENPALPDLAIVNSFSETRSRATPREPNVFSGFLSGG
jgi:uncharacterized phage protein (TIGR02218 family)